MAHGTWHMAYGIWHVSDTIEASGERTARVDFPGTSPAAIGRNTGTAPEEDPMPALRSPRPTGEKPDDLNLVPIMNLVVCLIPIVLLGTSLIQVGTIETEAPRICSSCGGGGDEEPLGLRITVGSDGFELQASDRVALNTALMDLQDPTVADPQSVHLPRKGDALDFVGLYNALVQLKAERPDAASVFVSAGEGVPWREVVATLDVARHRLAEDHYADARALAAAQPRAGTAEARMLFPVASLTVAAR